MSESANRQNASLEDLLRGLAELPPAQRRPIEAPHDVSDFGRSSILAAVVALMIFVPGCAASAFLLLQSDDAIASPGLSPGSDPLLTKSDRLPPFARPVEPAHDSIAHALVLGDVKSMSALYTPRNIAAVVPATMRGRIEDLPIAATSAGANAQDAMAELITSPTPKPKARHRLAPVKQPKLVAEVVQPEPEPPSLLQRLFGQISLNPITPSES